MRRAVTGALFAAVVVAAAARPARAYVRYKTDQGVGFFWPAPPCVGFIVYTDAIADMMPADQVLNAASGAGAAWSAGQNDTSLLIQAVGMTGPSAVAKYDGQNSVIFHELEWCSASGMEPCGYDPTALAITTVLAKSDGRIVDADIEVNAKYFTWADVDLLPATHGTDVQDLQNALTHEMGHAIGLDHPCYLSNTAPNPVPTDNLGNPVPDCMDAPAAVLESTMFPSAVPGDTSKRTLAADDQLAVSEIYPSSLAASPPMCPTPKPVSLANSGCAMVGDGRYTHASALAAAAFMLMAAARRRRQP